MQHRPPSRVIQPGPRSVMRCLGKASRSPGEAGHAKYAPDPRGRASGAAAAPARAGAQVTLCVHLRARSMVERAGIEAKLSFKAHPHMLRHACGYALANKGHDTRALQAYLGHRNIQHTVRYTELSPTRFKDFWRK